MRMENWEMKMNIFKIKMYNRDIRMDKWKLKIVKWRRKKWILLEWNMFLRVLLNTAKLERPERKLDNDLRFIFMQ